MTKIYNVQYYDGILYAELVGGETFILDMPVYFNEFFGLLYTEQSSYIVMSIENSEDTIPYIRSCLNEVWERV